MASKCSVPAVITSGCVATPFTPFAVNRKASARVSPPKRLSPPCFLRANSSLERKLTELARFRAEGQPLFCRQIWTKRSIGWSDRSTIS